MNKSLKYFIIEVFKNFPKKFLFLLILLLMESLILASSVLAIVPLADYLLDPNLNNPSKITKTAIKILELFSIQPSYFIFGGIFILTNFIRSVFALSIQYSILKTKYSIVKFLTLDLLKNIFQAKWSFFNNLGPGKLLNTLNRELPRVGDAIGHLATILSMFVQLITYLIIPIILDVKLTVYTLTLALVLGLPFLLLNKLSHKLGELNTKTSNFIMNVMNESIQGAKIILGFGNKKNALVKNEEALNKHINVTIKSQIIGNFTNHFFKPLAILSIIIAIGLSISSDKNLSEYVAIFWSLFAVVPVLGQLLNTRVVINNFLPSYEQLKEIKEKAVNNVELISGKKFQNLQGKIVFKDVFFKYQEKENIIENCSFEIKKNEITAIIGKSGSGKSTIVDLILGLCRPIKGEILVDDNQLNKMDLDSYRNKVSFVSQEPFLFYSTIKENLLWSKSDASYEDIVESLKIANVYDFVMSLPNKLDTYVGERGTELSGGERQRIILARAILRKPQLLVLDEATSSLDQESEELINSSIQKISKFTTILVIAHRASSVNIAKTILVLKKGKIVEKGNFESLQTIKNSEFSKILYEFRSGV